MSRLPYSFLLFLHDDDSFPNCRDCYKRPEERIYGLLCHLVVGITHPPYTYKLLFLGEELREGNSFRTVLGDAGYTSFCLFLYAAQIATTSLKCSNSNSSSRTSFFPPIYLKSLYSTRQYMLYC